MTSSYYADDTIYTSLAEVDTVLAELNAAITTMNADTAASTANAATATTQAGIATTQAGIATTQAGIATTQATNAAASASTASTQATNAAASASTATTQAGIATTQAGNASTSATNAASSASSALSSWNSFNAEYLGAKSADPTTNNTGGSLAEGMLYWNSTAHNLRIYNGSAWNVYSATAGDMLKSVYDTNNDGLIDVAAGGTGVATATTNKVFAAPNGSTGAPSFRALVGADLPAPAASTLGGVKSLASSASKWINAIATDGTPSATQPAFSDISGTVAAAQGGAGTINGLLKANGSGAVSAATSGTDYCAATSGSTVLKGSSGNTTAATAGTDYVAPGTATAFTAQQGFTLAALTDGTTISWTVSSGQKAKVTLGGNRTMSAVTGAVEGNTYFLWVIQDATGSRTLSWTTTGAGSFDFGNDGAPTLTTTASRADLLCFEAVSIGGTLKLRYCGIKKGFA
jgi:hypothetical protein